MKRQDIEALREWHIAQLGFHRLDEVEMCQCGTFKWPCDVIKVLDELELVNARVDKAVKMLRAVPQQGSPQLLARFLMGYHDELLEAE